VAGCEQRFPGGGRKKAFYPGEAVEGSLDTGGQQSSVDSNVVEGVNQLRWIRRDEKPLSYQGVYYDAKSVIVEGGIMPCGTEKLPDSFYSEHELRKRNLW